MTTEPVDGIANVLIGALLADEAPDPAVERFIDAAQTQFENLGFRRTTLEDIAKRAGVDRVTIYRRLGSKDDVIQAVINRELRRLIAHVTAAIEPATTIEDTAAGGFVATIQFFRTNALYHRLLTLDAEMVIPKLTTEAGPVLAIATAAAALMLEQAIADGKTDRVGDPVTIAEAGVRLIHSFLLTPHVTVDLEETEQLRAFALATLLPLVS